MPPDAPRQSQEMRFRDYFLVGAVLGLFWSLFRYPWACGCVALLLVLPVLFIGGVAIYALWQIRYLLFIGFVIFIAWLILRRPNLWR